MGSCSSCASVVFIISALLHIANCIDSGSVIFVDSPNHRYFRPFLHEFSEVESYSQTEVGAVVSVLLGLKPPRSLSISSSNKLNKLLIPNPFERPRSVLILEVSGVSDSFFTWFDDSISMKGLTDSAETQIHLPVEEINVVALDTEQTTTHTYEEIREFALWFDGSYNLPTNTFDGELLLPLPSGQSLKLQMSEEADRIFAMNLITLFKAIQTTATAHMDLPHGTQRPSELITVSFNGLMVLRNQYGSGDFVNRGLEALIATVSKSFETRKTAYKTEIVGVVFLKDSEKKIMNVIHTPHGSMRVLKESDSSKNVTDKETELARRTLTWVTAIILLVSSYIGIYFLVYMPLTKDTLLYSVGKLD